MLRRAEHQHTPAIALDDIPDDFCDALTVTLIPLFAEVKLTNGYEVFIVQNRVDLDVLFERDRPKRRFVVVGLKPLSQLR